MKLGATRLITLDVKGRTRLVLATGEPLLQRAALALVEELLESGAYPEHEAVAGRAIELYGEGKVLAPWDFLRWHSKQPHGYPCDLRFAEEP
jgi:hypothetical protein